MDYTILTPLVSFMYIQVYEAHRLDSIINVFCPCLNDSVENSLLFCAILIMHLSRLLSREFRAITVNDTVHCVINYAINVSESGTTTYGLQAFIPRAASTSVKKQQVPAGA